MYEYVYIRLVLWDMDVCESRAAITGGPPPTAHHFVTNTAHPPLVPLHPAPCRPHGTVRGCSPSKRECVCVCVCMNICMYVCMYVCM
ncbi:hypothetical protein K437DRAFT_153150 [Tilletiaria anomala UBC 951]|uniref:Uncharacterized protein n=1 Tax=Tilletiaria anomala (strain ATCC 24038 / CBS 436.72 / UBC 951) TaxID=1037660 RepID=A0A066VWZ5_TILAU|nr:uncharacterized protein K437DRAFT_153150 [Tilletiaria anomala UBC 951]KDN43314.1 hypothetical protein K437DRAFT_153150 [Tilletiaria anomala UBC 951]